MMKMGRTENSRVIAPVQVLAIILILITAVQVDSEESRLVLNGVAIGESTIDVVDRLQIGGYSIMRRGCLITAQHRNDWPRLLIVAERDGMVRAVYSTTPDLRFRGETWDCNYGSSCFKERILPYRSKIVVSGESHREYFEKLQLMVLSRRNAVRAMMLGDSSAEALFKE